MKIAAPAMDVYTRPCTPNNIDASTPPSSPLATPSLHSEQHTGDCACKEPPSSQLEQNTQGLGMQGASSAPR
eukprot:36320-Rhodomonas_salina.3